MRRLFEEEGLELDFCLRRTSLAGLWQTLHQSHPHTNTTGKDGFKTCCLKSLKGFPGVSVSKRIYLQSRRLGFSFWVGRISCRRKWQPTLVFLPGKFHEQRSLAGYSPCHKSQTWFSDQTTTTTKVTEKFLRRQRRLKVLEKRKIQRCRYNIWHFLICQDICKFYNNGLEAFWWSHGAEGTVKLSICQWRKALISTWCIQREPLKCYILGVRTNWK